MGTNHEYYEPTEYEQMLVAAGWVTLESLDEDYQAYLCIPEHRLWSDGHLTYDQWQRTKREFDAANLAYEAEIDPFIRQNVNLTRVQQDREAELIAIMSDCEKTLGY